MTSRGAIYWNSGSIPLIAPEILGDIIAEVADLALVISETGEIQSVLVNPLYDSFRAMERLENCDIRTALTTESIPKFERRLADFVAGKSPIRAVELNHSDVVGTWEFPVRYSLHKIGPDGAILMLGRDLRPVAEMQQQLVNAQLALEQDYEVQRENDTRFRILMDTTTEAMVFVSAESGRVVDANAAAANLFGTDLNSIAGAALTKIFATRTSGDLLADLTTSAIAQSETPVLASPEQGGPQLKIVPKMFRSAGERLLLCRIEPAEARPTQANELALNLLSMFRATADSIVFTNQDGSILSANDAFLSLIDAGHDGGIKGTNLADLLQRGSVDVKVMVENASRSGHMRMYATRIAGTYGSPRQVEISISQVQAGADHIFAFVMREASGVDTPRGEATLPVNDTVQSVKELVGQASLKDIVAETTNVVEKMCIETAVALTMNNRVAAAEMLGLSRQSLYVKLRKFGLLARDPDTSE